MLRKDSLKTTHNRRIPVGLGYPSLRMDRLSDSTRGVLAIPVEDQSQMNQDMKDFISNPKTP